jgi:hypothetical protein
MLENMRGIWLVVLAIGCSEQGKDVIAKLAPRFRELNARLAPMAKSLPPSPVTERSGGPLSPPAVMGDHGNAWLLSLWGLADHVDSCVNLDGWLDQAMAMSVRDVPNRELANLRGPYAKKLRQAEEEVLALRYVVFQRSVDCHNPDDANGSATVEAFVVDVTSGRIERAVRVAVSAGGKTLAEVAHDRLLGALAGRAGVDVQLRTFRGEPIVPITTPEPPLVAEAPPAKSTKRCTVDTPEAGIEDVGGGMPCDEAEALAKKLRASGFDAKVLPSR